MPRSRVTWWCGIGWQTWSGVFAAAVALGAGEIRTASLAAGRRGGAGLLKLSLQAFGQPLQLAARSCLTLPVGAHPLGAGLCHSPSVAASNVTRGPS
jgi:hypothetical protein